MSTPEPTADLDQLRATVTRADAAFQELESTGGLLSIPDIAARSGGDKEIVRGYRARSTSDARHPASRGAARHARTPGPAATSTIDPDLV